MLLCVLLCSEVKFVVGDAAKLPAVLKALKGFKGSLKGIAYWGKAAPDVIKVSKLPLCVYNPLTNGSVGDRLSAGLCSNSLVHWWHGSVDFAPQLSLTYAVCSQPPSCSAVPLSSCGC